MTDPPQIVDEAELAALQARYGDFARTHHRVEMRPDSLENYRRQAKRRRGEILLLLTRPNGDVLLHTKHFYPAGVYRLPTGGIDWGEPIVAAWHRELREETQLPGDGERLLAIIRYEFTGHGEPVPFVSYVFHLGNVEGTPRPLDEKEGITDFRWVPRPQLADTAALLRGLDHTDPPKGDWGRFRAIAHEVLVSMDW